jgi:hypothetical protein
MPVGVLQLSTLLRLKMFIWEVARKTTLIVQTYFVPALRTIELQIVRVLL